MPPKIPISPAQLLSQTTYPVAGKMLVTEHTFSVPRDHAQPHKGGTIQLFARSIRKSPPFPSSASAKPNQANSSPLPWMLYLNGGPGFPCRAPQHYPFAARVLEAGYRLLLLDQRGTGLSTPLTAATLGLSGGEEAQAGELRRYRADSIVRDCEAVRMAVTAEDEAGDGGPGDMEGEGRNAEGRKWSVMGQSFGGFCGVTYLSFYPEGLREVFLFGGLQPLVKSPDEVYRRLFVKLKQRNAAYYAKHPDDAVRIKTILAYLARSGDGAIKLPSEGNLTRRRFRQIGLSLGFHGGVDAIHDVVLRAAYDIGAFGHLTPGSLVAIEGMTSFDENLLYAILHEPLYCEGRAANWAAWRVMQEEFGEDFSVDGRDGGPVLLTGEMIFPWMFEDYAELRKVQGVAERVAADADWPPLFNEEQLARNEVPVYAASFTEDMYVDSEFALETAGKIRGCKVFSTNILLHDAIRSRMDEVVKQVFALRDDVID